MPIRPTLLVVEMMRSGMLTCRVWLASGMLCPRIGGCVCPWAVAPAIRQPHAACSGARASVDSHGQLLYNSRALCSRRSAHAGRWLPRRPGFAAAADMVRPVIGGGDSRRTPSTSLRLHSPRDVAPNDWASKPVPRGDSAAVCGQARGGHFQSVTKARLPPGQIVRQGAEFCVSWAQGGTCFMRRCSVYGFR